MTRIAPRIKPRLALVTPALADANNGNWQTAARWARMLSADYRVRLLPAWDGDARDELMVALHARRSADSIHAWAQAHPGRPLILVLTGTDLYRDIREDRAAQRALREATRLVVLHERAIDDLPAAQQAKAVVCLQSCAARKTLRKPAGFVRAVVVGHLRPEKDPRTVMAVAKLLGGRPDIRIAHIGRSLVPELGQEAEALSLMEGPYRWLGELEPAETRRCIQQAHVLLHASLMEGGAHAVIEAVRSGTPVLASRVPGNVGLLGEDYGGYVPAGDAQALAALLQRCRDDAAMLPRLQAQCAARAPLFEPARERETLLWIVAETMKASDERPRTTS
ncbi:MAG: TIGR04348 family glycosyltransferase [Rubrivivax sp.]|nr:TIGR04348 family glycosyltransferase [Rubrivivax sp.]